MAEKLKLIDKDEFHQKERLVFLPSGRKPLYLALRNRDKKSYFSPDVTGRIARVGVANEKDYYSPQERAELLYEAITAKDDKGKYLYHHIGLAGGNGADDTIVAFEKLLQGPPAKALPRRWKDLNIYGFSDVSQLHHYFGQRQVATCFYYSNTQNLYRDVIDTLKRQKESRSLMGRFKKDKTAFLMDLKVVQNPKNIKYINGFTQPGSITSVEHRPTHQLRPFAQGSNLLIVELTNEVQIARLGETLDQMKDKDISLLLSKDMTEDMVTLVRDTFPDIPVFYGALVGHGGCMREGKPIPLFAESRIEIQGDKARIMINPVASDKAKQLLRNPKRKPKIHESGSDATTHLNITGFDSAGRAVLSDLTKIKQNQSCYTIHIDRPGATWQKMELGIKELLENGIINPDTLQEIDFKGNNKVNPLNRETLTVMKELVDMYLPNLKRMTYNNTEMPVRGLKSFLMKKSDTLDRATATLRHQREALIRYAEKNGTPLSADRVMALRKKEEKARFLINKKHHQEH